MEEDRNEVGYWIGQLDVDLVGNMSLPLKVSGRSEHSATCLVPGRRQKDLRENLSESPPPCCPILMSHLLAHFA